jgi:hypothetical protein
MQLLKIRGEMGKLIGKAKCRRVRMREDAQVPKMFGDGETCPHNRGATDHTPTITGNPRGSMVTARNPTCSTRRNTVQTRLIDSKRKWSSA